MNLFKWYNLLLFNIKHTWLQENNTHLATPDEGGVEQGMCIRGWGGEWDKGRYKYLIMYM